MRLRGDKMEVKQAVIMVGGKGTRLYPLTENTPKPALPVLDMPCLKYLIRSFASAGITDVFLACGYKSDVLQKAIGDGSDLGVNIVYSDEDTPLGTGGAMKQLEDRLDPVFAAANGDTFIDIDMCSVIPIIWQQRHAQLRKATVESGLVVFGRLQEKRLGEHAFCSQVQQCVVISARHGNIHIAIPRYETPGSQRTKQRAMRCNVGQPELVANNVKCSEQLEQPLVTCGLLRFFGRNGRRCPLHGSRAGFVVALG